MVLDNDIYKQLKKDKQMLLHQMNQKFYSPNPTAFLSSDNKDPVHNSSALIKLYSNYRPTMEMQSKKPELSQNIRDTYSIIIKSKESANFDLLNSISPKKKISSPKHTKKTDKDNDTILLNKLSDEAFNSFVKKLGVYNKYHTSYLMEPNQGYFTMKDLQLKSIQGYDYNSRCQLEKQNRSPVSLTKGQLFSIGEIIPEKLFIEPIRSLSFSPFNNTIISNMELEKQKLQNQSTKIKKEENFNIMESMDSARAELEMQEEKIHDNGNKEDRQKTNEIARVLEKVPPLGYLEKEFLRCVKNGLEKEVDLMLLENPKLRFIKDMVLNKI